MKRIGVVLGVVALLAALVAGPVAAQADRERVLFSEPFVAETGNCEDELVTLTGEFNGFSQVVTTPSGETVVKAHFRTQGEGVDAQGNTYIFSSIGNEEYLGDFTAGGPAAITISQRLVSPGFEDNLFIQGVAHISLDGEVVFDNVRVECRG